MSKKVLKGIVWTGITGVIALILGGVGRSIIESLSYSATQTIVVLLWALFLVAAWAYVSWVYAWNRSFS